MRIILHIGQHKTGTTSIQKTLARNNGYLIEEMKTFYPKVVGGAKYFSHYQLANYSFSPDRLYNTKRQKIYKNDRTKLNEVLVRDIDRHMKVATEVIPCDTVIYSSEDLYLLNSEEEYQKLKDLFLPYSTHIEHIECVCCFRDKVSYMNSYKKQIIACHGREKVKKLYNIKDSFCYTESDSWLLDYERKKELCNNVFDKTIFFDYNKENNVLNFFNSIGYDIPEKMTMLRANKTN